MNNSVRGCLPLAWVHPASYREGNKRQPSLVPEEGAKFSAAKICTDVFRGKSHSLPVVIRVSLEYQYLKHWDFCYNKQWDPRPTN